MPRSLINRAKAREIIDVLARDTYIRQVDASTWVHLEGVVIAELDRLVRRNARFRRLRPVHLTPEQQAACMPRRRASSSRVPRPPP